MFGEVQEMIDICDFAVGLLRELLKMQRQIEAECFGRLEVDQLEGWGLGPGTNYISSRSNSASPPSTVS
jgi:hypothetical protein